VSEAGGKLAVSVTLRDSKFQLATFPAGSTPPAWAAALITNPKAWGSAAPAPTPEVKSQEDAPPAPEDQAPADGPEPDAEPVEDLVGELPEPPKRGAGSGRDAWAAYARSKGVVVTDDMTRDDIVDALDA
jgi:hypothetical protein